jgi:hypothetical protein
MVVRCIILLFIVVTIQAVPVAKITFQFDTLTEVGEAVFLSAASCTNVTNMQTATYEWDFGDGYAMKIGYPLASNEHSGICCTHLFMKPGRFKVMLRVTDANKTKDSTYVYFTVSGTAPLAGFELWHAPFHARIAQYIYAQIPSTITANSQNVLKATVRKSSDNEIVATLLEKSGLKKEERFLLKNADLPNGTYYLLVEILDPAQNCLSSIKEKIAKPYDGAPKVGINENNAIMVGGKLFFPVTPWLLNTEEYPAWAGNYVNSCYGEGWYPSHSTTTWTDYVTVAEKHNLFMIGPSRWDGLGEVNYEKNANPLKIVEYVNATKSKTMMGMWMWKDEPNLGGRACEVPAEVMDGWSYLSHVNDPQHPVACNLYGFDYLSYYNPPRTYVDYLGSEAYFGGKKRFCFDVTGFDIYPIHFGTHESLKGKRVMAEYVAAFDRMRQNNYDLIPSMSFIEVQDIGDRPTPPPTPDQILMEAWLSVIHGAKGINWFPYFGKTPPESFNAMGKFYKQMVKFGSVILSAPCPRPFSSSATAPSNRVDGLLRDYVVNTDTSIYLFTARLTEPDSSASFVNWKEPDSIVATFTVAGLSGRTVEVEGENRTLASTGDSFRDTFRKNAVHVYRIGKDLIPIRITKSIRVGSAVVVKSRVSCAPFTGSLMLPLSPQDRSVSFFNLKGVLIAKARVKQATLRWGTVPAAGAYLYRVSNNIQKSGFVMLRY